MRACFFATQRYRSRRPRVLERGLSASKANAFSPSVSNPTFPRSESDTIDLQGGYLVPGYVDLHVHAAAGRRFMDGTRTLSHVCQAHARHGTTSLLPTTTVARHDQHLAFFDVCRRLKKDGTGGARILGAHFYGPYFAPEARGCHPAAPVRPPLPEEFEQYLAFTDWITTATVAPELPGAEAFVRACRKCGIRCNAGHSYATFEQMEQALAWGVRHVDHLFCAMSDRARLARARPFPCAEASWKRRFISII